MKKRCPNCGEDRDCHVITRQDVHVGAEHGHVDEVDVYECPEGHTFTEAKKTGALYASGG